MFVNLNTRSYYSLLSTNLSISKIIEFAIENKQTHVCLTDFNVLYGAVEFFNLAKKNNLVPIIGLEIFDISSNSELVLIAKNNDGYLKLIKISSLASSSIEFNIFDYLDDNLFLIVKSGNFWWDHPNCLNKDDLAFNFANCYDLKDKVGLNLINAISIKQSGQKSKFEINELYNDDIVLASPFLSTNQANSKFSDKQLDKLNDLIQKCSFWDLDNLKKNTIIKYKTPKGFDSNTYLEELCKKSFNELLDKKLVKLDDIKRLVSELDVIKRLNFSDYFLFVYDFIYFAKKEGIVIGPGRGSAAGSFVSYLLNITTINPIEYGLIFERFLNPERKSMPDIDVDIMDSRREDVAKYIFDKYSKNNVANIITFQRIKVKNAIRDVCRVLDLKTSETDEVIKFVSYDEIEEWEQNKDSAGLKKVIKCQECDEFNKNCGRSGNVSCYKIRKIFDLAEMIFNVPRQIGSHAAGIVCGNEPLDACIPLIYSGDRATSQFSMEYLEQFGLIKIDLLGLKTLTIIDEINNLVKLNHDKNFDINKVELDNKETFNLLKKSYTKGVFQLESVGMQNVLRKVLPDSLEDISIISALFRPGPQQNIDEYVERKFSNKKYDHLSDELIDILKPTHGIIVYQEQVINTAIVVAKFSAAQADLFRRAISKKDEELLLKEKDNFIRQATKNNYTKEKAVEIFEYLHKFADYGFNHSHSLAYAFLAYQMAYLKANYPKEFYLTLLRHNIDTKSKLADYFIEIIERNISLVKPSINLSDASFSLSSDGQKIILGFNMINGLGSEIANKIIEARNNKRFDSFIDCLINLHKKGITKVLFEKLINAGVFDEYRQEFSKKVMIALVKNYYDENNSYKSDDDLISFQEKKEIINSNIFFLNKQNPELFSVLTREELEKENEQTDSLLKVSFLDLKNKIYKPNIFKSEITKLEKNIKNLKTVKELKGTLNKEVCSMLVQIKKKELKNKIWRFTVFDGAYQINVKVRDLKLVEYLSNFIDKEDKLLIRLERDIFRGYDSYTALGLIEYKNNHE
ncbi:DNA polymerase III subunit alpha [Mycoplasma sp. T363T]|uniref:DNA polymerase III subunit alpha n=1 Tax=Mycoplasma bradburyae TaxID=2963128 RepID=UPI002342549D|nr:DNA polymerase III subunit alpha [Mycoplasma bradburyae]MDC4163291.1 DNA polymerase III subunit alpha [Mycoplasma bradburyae]